MNSGMRSQKLRILALAASLLAASWIIISQRLEPSPIDVLEIGRNDDTTSRPAISIFPDVNPRGPLRTKSKERSNVPKDATDERTLSLLTNSTVAHVTFPEQSLKDRIAALDQSVMEAGVDRSELQIIFNLQDPEFNKTVGPIIAADMPLITLMRYICAGTGLRFRITSGIMEFYNPDSESDLDSNLK